MSLLIFIYLTLLMGCVNTHQRHAKNFGGASSGYRTSLDISVLSGRVIGLLLLIYLGIITVWYVPIITFIGMSIATGIMFGLLDITAGLFILSISSFTWPIFAYLAFSEIATIIS